MDARSDDDAEAAPEAVGSDAAASGGSDSDARAPVRAPVRAPPNPLATRFIFKCLAVGCPYLVEGRTKGVDDNSRIRACSSVCLAIVKAAEAAADAATAAARAAEIASADDPDAAAEKARMAERARLTASNQRRVVTTAEAAAKKLAVLMAEQCKLAESRVSAAADEPAPWYFFASTGARADVIRAPGLALRRMGEGGEVRMMGKDSAAASFMKDAWTASGYLSNGAAKPPTLGYGPLTSLLKRYGAGKVFNADDLVLQWEREAASPAASPSIPPLGASSPSPDPALRDSPDAPRDVPADGLALLYGQLRWGLVCWAISLIGLFGSAEPLRIVAETAAAFAATFPAREDSAHARVSRAFSALCSGRVEPRKFAARAHALLRAVGREDVLDQQDTSEVLQLALQCMLREALDADKARAGRVHLEALRLLSALDGVLCGLTVTVTRPKCAHCERPASITSRVVADVTQKASVWPVGRNTDLRPGAAAAVPAASRCSTPVGMAPPSAGAVCLAQALNCSFVDRADGPGCLCECQHPRPTVTVTAPQPDSAPAALMVAFNVDADVSVPLEMIMGNRAYLLMFVNLRDPKLPQRRDDPLMPRGGAHYRHLRRAGDRWVLIDDHDVRIVQPDEFTDLTRRFGVSAVYEMDAPPPLAEDLPGALLGGGVEPAEAAPADASADDDALVIEAAAAEVAWAKKQPPEDVAVVVAGSGEDAISFAKVTPFLERSFWVSDVHIGALAARLNARSAANGTGVVICSPSFLTRLRYGSYDFAGVQRWTKRLVLDGLRRLVLPAFVAAGSPAEHDAALAQRKAVANHWAVVVLDFGAQTCVYMDSKPFHERSGVAVAETALRWLRDEWRVKKGGELPAGWTCRAKRFAWQVDDNSCGIYVAALLMRIADGFDITPAELAAVERKPSVWRARFLLTVLGERAAREARRAADALKRALPSSSDDDDDDGGAGVIIVDDGTAGAPSVRGAPAAKRARGARGTLSEDDSGGGEAGGPPAAGAPAAKRARGARGTLSEDDSGGGEAGGPPLCARSEGCGADASAPLAAEPPPPPPPPPAATASSDEERSSGSGSGSDDEAGFVRRRKRKGGSWRRRGA